MVVWYIFPRFGILYQEKSGNPATGYVAESKVEVIHMNGRQSQTKYIPFLLSSDHLLKTSNKLGVFRNALGRTCKQCRTQAIKLLTTRQRS
jgi:hypothetical protein